MGLFNRRNEYSDPHRLGGLEKQIADLRAQLSTPMAPPPSAPPRLLDADDTEASIADLRAQLGRVDNQLASLDHRITSISTELANQISELGTEIEHLSTSLRADDGAAVEPEVLDQLREAQTKLANEQVRYQIALREDLAELAQRIKR